MGISGLSYSKVVDVASTLSAPFREKMTEALLNFLHHTLTSDLVALAIKEQRFNVCKETMDTAPLSR